MLRLVNSDDAPKQRADSALGTSAGRSGLTGRPAERLANPRLRLSAGRVTPRTPEAQDEAQAARTIGQVMRSRSAPTRPQQRVPLHAAPSLDELITEGTTPPTERELRTARQSVARENLVASALPVTDVRWMLAIKVQHELEGGRAAMLTPDKRKRLVSDARLMGLRDFDANLVIAIVQDQARLGLKPVGEDFAGRLSLVGGAGFVNAEKDRKSTIFVAATCAALLALAAIYAAARWIVWGH